MNLQKLEKSVKDEFKKQLDSQLNIDIDLACQEFRKKMIKYKNEFLLSVMDSVEFQIRTDAHSDNIIFEIKRK